MPQIAPKLQKEALNKIVDAANQAYNDLGPAMGHRHFVVGIGGINEDKTDLYWLLLQAENAIARVKARAQMALAKR